MNDKIHNRFIVIFDNDDGDEEGSWGYIAQWATNITEAIILAQAERIKEGKPYKVLDAYYKED
jgi:hypothetical protein